MKLSKSIIHTAGSICLLFIVLLIPVCAKAQSLNDLQWGTTVDGLQLSISQIALPVSESVS